ncbi:GNAT family N-acetyltransferase [Phototrophicus methaneseepsis]|uniref:GNAT family N-acetyltransferase n=1 Tax=Phototrophicus methaneseepsis TaxID=2710758 RepID=A0A7S8E5G3_9CHLR|nr:GNAT family N-acetyltransferase [Phototrophicus methaneseepsis]QPC80721.1 GNAT family N-acetyltransferase [Phototrophicus methaneseepsis]
MSRKYPLPPQPRQGWESAAAEWLNNEDICFQVAFLRGELIGCIQADIVQDVPQLPYGRINQLILDMHAQQAVHGLGQALVDVAKAWLAERGITQIMIHTPMLTPVEQAFWRGVGITKKDDIFWLMIG